MHEPMMKGAVLAGIVFVGLFSDAKAQHQPLQSNPSAAQLHDPQYSPFEYSYNSEDLEGSHSAQASGDESGRVTGSYSLTLADGRTRTVTYVADENGYRAEVTTNEVGTESKNSADVIWNSSAVTGHEAAVHSGSHQDVGVQRNSKLNSEPGTRNLHSASQTGQRSATFRGSVNVPTYGTFAGSSHG